MSDNSNSVSYDYDEDSAAKADNFVGRISESGPYIGRFVSVNAMKSREKGTQGVHFEFKTEGDGSAGFDLWTKKADGTPVFGMDLLNAIQAVLGVKGLQSKTGKYEGFVDGKREEIEGEIFPQLMDKEIGVVFQKELYTKGDGGDGYRMNLAGTFHATTKLTASEIKERKTTPEKLTKLLKTLKTKDTRTARAAEPAQPAVGADAGSY